MDQGVEFYRAVLERAFPELVGATFSLMTEGWDSVAVDVDARLIFKFPRDGKAERALRREHAILDVVRPLVSIRVPDLTLHAGPPLFSRHEKIPGDPLLTTDYRMLSEPARQRLADQLAEFYAQLHAIDRTRLAHVSPVHFGPDLDADALRRKLDPVLPPDLRSLATLALAAWRDLGPDPHGEIFGFMDGHSWNMAFDLDRGQLNGVFDFADARVAPLHGEFVCSNFVDRDLTRRIIAGYERHTGRHVDRDRVELLSSILFLTELATHEAHPDKVPQFVATLRAWLSASPAGL